MQKKIAFLAGVILSGVCGNAIAAPVIFHVTMGNSTAMQQASGRLLIFAEPIDKALAQSKGGAITAVDVDLLDPSAVTIAAQEIPHIAPGETIDVDADVTAFPEAFSRLKAGRYAVQAVLDTRHEYNYDFANRRQESLVSDVAQIDLPAGGDLQLTHFEPAVNPLTPPAGTPDDQKAAYPLAAKDIHSIDFESRLLSDFSGRPIHMHAWVLLPPGYGAGNKHYPVAYWTHGFGTTAPIIHDTAVNYWRMMNSGDIPQMIWVFLDQSSPTGTHEFVDSVNNGPWGKALTTEFIPHLEKMYRMDARPSGRFLTGKSSGGWASLWLQVRYPQIFGGTWSISPDSVDYHDWSGVNLYTPGANVYRKPDGSAAPLIRDHGQVLSNVEQFSKQEAVLGPVGGQMSSFDWVFSPRGPQGMPLPMFNRVTGAVDPAVMAYWHDHWDISALMQRTSPNVRKALAGKVHMMVGTEDTFYLDGSVHLLQSSMERAGVPANFRYLVGKNHFDIFQIGNDRNGLLKTVAREMYAVARPNGNSPAQ